MHQSNTLINNLPYGELRSYYSIQIIEGLVRSIIVVQFTHTNHKYLKRIIPVCSNVRSIIYAHRNLHKTEVWLFVVNIVVMHSTRSN